VRLRESRTKLQDGREYVFGFLQLDIAGSSALPGPPIKQQETKTNLRKMVIGVLEKIYGARRLSWPEDGGAFTFVIDQPKNDYDKMVWAALHVLDNMRFFNEAKPVMNSLETRISVPISCHEEGAHYHTNPEQMHSSTLNYFLKYQRQFGAENRVTITEDVYNRLVAPELKLRVAQLHRDAAVG